MKRASSKYIVTSITKLPIIQVYTLPKTNKYSHYSPLKVSPNHSKRASHLPSIAFHWLLLLVSGKIIQVGPKTFNHLLAPKETHSPGMVNASGRATTWYISMGSAYKPSSLGWPMLNCRWLLQGHVTSRLKYTRLPPEIGFWSLYIIYIYFFLFFFQGIVYFPCIHFLWKHISKKQKIYQSIVVGICIC